MCIEKWRTPLKLISAWNECFKSVVDLVHGGPFFLNRIGGSDTNAVALYLHMKSRNESLDCYAMRNRKHLVERYNGYYDFFQAPDTYLRYCEELLGGYRTSKHLVFCNYQLISMYFPNTLPADGDLPDIANRAELKTLIDDISTRNQKVCVYPYGFIEKLLIDKFTLFRAFETALIGKTVLVVSPFSKSIAKNFGRRHEFFKSYRYPDFELKLVNAPITYAGLPAEFYPHNNWFETLDSLKESLSSVDFDIALLSCGSYAGPLGLHIETGLHKQAIYVGGVLQLYFGIMGRRYTGPFVQQQLNHDAFIWPVERDDLLPHVELQGNGPTEGFGAYF
jgi:hypothetical protein